MVTYPGFLFSKPCSVPFDELLASVTSFANSGASLVFYHYNGITGTSISAGDYIPIRNWSFIVWYMDKTVIYHQVKRLTLIEKKIFIAVKPRGFLLLCIKAIFLQEIVLFLPKILQKTKTLKKITLFPKRIPLRKGRKNDDDNK